MTVYTLVAMHSWLGLRLRGVSPLVCVLASSAVVQRKIEQQCGVHLMTPLLQNTDAILQLGHLIFESFDITFICFHVQHKTLNCLSNQVAPRMQPLHRLSTDKLARHKSPSVTTTRRAQTGAVGVITTTHIRLHAHIAEALFWHGGDKLNKMQIPKWLGPRKALEWIAGEVPTNSISTFWGAQVYINLSN